MRTCLKKQNNPPQNKQCINQKKDVHGSSGSLSSLLSCSGLVVQQRPVLIAGAVEKSALCGGKTQSFLFEAGWCLPEPTLAQGDKVDRRGTSLQPCWTPKLGVQTQAIQVHCKGHSSHLYMVPALLHVCFLWLGKITPWR